MTSPTPVTLVTGGSAGMREAAIAARIISDNQVLAVPSPRIAIILEGMPDGADHLEDVANNNPALSISRIAPGCPCCIGNLTMRVTLNRILRKPPEKLFISLATHAHLEQVRAFLIQHPYDKLLNFTKDIYV